MALRQAASAAVSGARGTPGRLQGQTSGTPGNAILWIGIFLIAMLIILNWQDIAETIF